MRKDFDGYIFDLDGTLWDSTENICRVWCDTLVENGYPPITVDAIKSVMGLPMDALFAKLLPDIAPEARARVGKECMRRENDYLAMLGGKTDPRLLETLNALSKRAKLFIVSNCQKGYIEAFLTAHDAARYFTAYRCFGDNNAPKDVNIRLLVDAYELKNAVYVGDTALDREGAILAGVSFIHAAYGFGAVGGTEKIDFIWELV